MIAGLIPIIISSCNYFNQDKDKDFPIARAFDKSLYFSEIQGIVPPNSSESDSIQIVNNYINNWIRQTVLLTQAEKNMTPDQLNIDKEIQDYKNSLIIFSYEQELIRQKLDTIITEKMIEEYYSKNPQNFTLRRSIAKLNLIRLKQNSPDIEKVRSWMLSKRENDQLTLEKYCYQYALEFNLNDTNWIYIDEIATKWSFSQLLSDNIYQGNVYKNTDENGVVSFVFVKEIKSKDDQSPITFEKDNIRNIILNKRKRELLDKLSNKMYADASKNNDFEIFELNEK